MTIRRAVADAVLLLGVLVIRLSASGQAGIYAVVEIVDQLLALVTVRTIRLP